MAKSYNEVDMSAIGGYFELELSKGVHYHAGALQLNCARNCLAYILKARQYRKIYIPYYTCAVIIEPLLRLGIDYSFYTINSSLEPSELPDIKPNEAILYTNYYGLKGDCVKRLSSVYGNQLIIDNAQAFFDEAIDGIDTFYSARKFFGVPDGAYLYTDQELYVDMPLDKSYSKCQFLLTRLDETAEDGYDDFLKNEEAFSHSPILRMSKLTSAIMSSINYNDVIKKRRENFHFLHAALKESNQLSLNVNDSCVPMVYPFWTNDKELRNHLIKQRIFISTYWKNVHQWCHSRLENKLAEFVLPLPIDQRYSEKTMLTIIECIQEKNLTHNFLN